MEEVAVNVVAATPNRLHKFKRKQVEDDYTPRSRHVDKKVPLHGNDSTPMRHSLLRKDDNKSLQSDNHAMLRYADEDKENAATPKASTKATTEESAADVFEIGEAQMNRQVSVGSIMSLPDLSASVLRATDGASDRPELETVQEGQSGANSDADSEPDPALPSPKGVSPSTSPNKETPLHASIRQALSPSPTRTPRLADFQLPITTPRSLFDTALRAHHASTARSATKSTSPLKSSFPTITEADLISFQTPAPRQHGSNHEVESSHMKRFIDRNGEEMLIDMTPRIYSPKSIPIYTLRDLDAIKDDFMRAQSEAELKVQSLHQELAASVSHANHHAALAAQGESLHAEYSKKHVRKVTALKTDWERKTLERVAVKEAKIIELEALVQELRKALEQEREEKKEVIAMAEAVLALQQA